MTINDLAMSPFVDLASDFYLFTSRLDARVKAAGIQHLYFFSREGAMLKDMFDYFQEQSGNPRATATHYLEVSRRSTFLPSLGPLDQENFEVLFRQYRKMSLSSFLKSLALDADEVSLLESAGMGRAEADDVQNDLQASTIFRRMLETPAFRSKYSHERETRSAALAAYVASFSGSLPHHLHVVDVGWKGSIQDNLFNWLRRAAGPSASIDGYYVGLIGRGLDDTNNRKTGLLFSSIPALTPGFRTFNENRSLFEVLLPARHGGPRSYEMTQAGHAQVLHDPFDEQPMIEKYVDPVAARMMEKFRNITRRFANQRMPDAALFDQAWREHARMVFEPRDDEIGWMCSVSHVENFGVFEQSRFDAGNGGDPLFQRLAYTLRLLITRKLGDSGFWPYLTLRCRALFGIHILYRKFRLWQDRRSLATTETH
jgi:hypothetical protein